MHKKINPKAYDTIATYKGTTLVFLQTHGTEVTSIIIDKKDNELIDVFIEDSKENKMKIAQSIDYVDIEGLTKDNDIYYVMMIGKGELYIADYILYKESVEHDNRTLTILIPLY